LQDITRSSFGNTEICTELWLPDYSHRSAYEELKFVCTLVTPGVHSWMIMVKKTPWCPESKGKMLTIEDVNGTTTPT
jgi:hypothetical protein